MQRNVGQSHDIVGSHLEEIGRKFLQEILIAGKEYYVLLDITMKLVIL